MFKIDWPTAIGGAVLGYYAKGRVEATKNQFKGIYTGAIQTLKESFSSEPQEAEKPQSQGQSNGQNG